jgi:acetolactate synthase-1/2/3 large subunit
MARMTSEAKPAGPLGSDLFADALVAGGVRTLFTVCGGHILHLLDSCAAAGIRVIDTRHEGAASLAAEGWALATGQTGVAAVTAGPGFTNALTGFVDAAVWTVPLVLLAGRTALRHAGRGAVMDVDQAAIAAPVAKWAATCYETTRIPRYAAEALYRARAGRPGAVYLEVPQDVLTATSPRVEDDLTGFPTEPPLPEPAAADVDAAAALLREAERPVILCGGGAFWSPGAGTAVARLAETALVPVITTSAARGVVPDGHPWCLGSLLHGGLALVSSDVVLVMGSAFNANVAYGAPPIFGSDQRVIQVDVSPEAMGGNRRPQLALLGDVGRTAEALTDARPEPAASNRAAREAWRGRARELAAASLERWNDQIERHPAGRTLVHHGAMAREVVQFAREACGGDVTFVVDGGDAQAWGLAYAHAERPGALLTTTTALGTLGVGMPYALAAGVARPADPVFLITGDGSFGLSAMEVDTCVRHRLRVIAVVSNNAGWGDVRHEQDAMLGGRHVASELSSSRYDLLGQALGAHGEHVTSLDQLRPALGRALDSGRPAVINVETDPAVLSELLRSIGQMGLM